MEKDEKIKTYLTAAWEDRLRANYTSAQENLRKAKALCRKNDHAFRGRIFHIERQTKADQDLWEEAAEYGWQAITAYQKAGDPQKIAHALRHQADVMCHLQCEVEARVLYEKALGIYTQSPHTATLDHANALRAYAILLFDLGKKTEALESWKTTESLYHTIGVLEGVDEAQDWIKRLRDH